MNGAEKLPSTTSRMRCPACGTQIRETEQLSAPDIVYRCPVCRLDFVPDRDTHTLTLAPLASSDPDLSTQSASTNDPPTTAAAIEDGATPSNLIRERIPLEVRVHGDAPPAMRPSRVVAPPQGRKRRASRG